MSTGSNMAATEYADTSGPNASMEFGEATRQKDLQRQAGLLAHGGTPNGPQPQAPQGPQPQGENRNSVPIPAVADQFRKPGGTLDMGKVFPPLPQAQPAWRDRLRQWAAHPQAGRITKQIAEQVAKQKGPIR